MKKIAVILAGSGYLDGAEIREAVGVLWALSFHKVEVQCFAPDMEQHHVIDHLTQQPVQETRNVLTEAARIARGKVKPLAELNTDEYDALILPGGFGAAKNLCTFAFDGSAGTVQADVARVVRDMIEAGKPVGAACIAPAILALTMKDRSLELTVGAEGQESAEIEKLGHKHFMTRPNQMHVDRANRIVTTPAYMYDDAPLNEVFDGIRQMVGEVVQMTLVKQNRKIGFQVA